MLVGGFENTLDGTYVLMAFKNFSGQIYAGESYPRWLYGFYNGHGAPMFYYYPPFLYYLQTLIDTLTFRILPDPLIPGLTALLLHISAAWCCYLWIRDCFGAKSALIAALLYSALPVHLAIDLYYKGAMTDLAAYTFLPLMIFLIRRMFRASSSYAGFIALSLSYALFITSTVPMTLAYSPLLLLYAIHMHFAQKQRRRQPLLMVSGAFITGFGLAGAHIITAYLMTPFIDAGEFWSGYFDPKNWFLCLIHCDSVPQNQRVMVLELYRITLIQCAAILFLFLYTRRRPPVLLQEQKNFSGTESLFWLFCTAGALFMMSAFSGILWEYLPLLDRIQFPWRFSIVTGLAFIFLISMLIRQHETTRGEEKKHPDEKGKIRLHTAGLAGELAWGSVLFFLAASAITIFTFLPRQGQFPEQMLRTRLEQNYYFSVYIPFARAPDIDIDALIKNPAAFVTVYSQSGQILPDAATFQEMPYGKRLMIQTHEPATVKIRQFYYPSWRAQSAMTGFTYSLGYDKKDGLIRLDFPGGTDTIVLTHKTTTQEKIGWGVSLLSLLILPGAATAARIKARNRKNAPT